MKKYIIGFIICISILLVGFLLIVKNVKYKNITYIERDKDGDPKACLTFYSNGKYSLYDCDSEPTGYFFDSENECHYTYVSNKLYFGCKYMDKNIDDFIEIKSWDKNTLKFYYKGELRTFKAK